MTSQFKELNNRADIFTPFTNLLPETKDIPDKAFNSFCDHIEYFQGFYKLDLMLEEHKLTDVQKHFLISLYLCIFKERLSPKENKEIAEIVDDIYERLGYSKADLSDKEFNRKVYQYVMLTEKVI